MKYGETRFSPNKFWKLYINSTCIWHILPMRNFKSLKGTYLYMTYLVPSSISIINQFIHINENSLGDLESNLVLHPLHYEQKVKPVHFHEHYMNITWTCESTFESHLMRLTLLNTLRLQCWSLHWPSLLLICPFGSFSPELIWH